MRHITGQDNRCGFAGVLGRWGQSGLLALCAGLLGLSTGCRDETDPQVSRSREVMGTLATVTAVGADQATATAAVEAAYARLDDVNRLMSDYIDDSEIGRLNKGPVNTAVPVSAETWDCLQRAMEISRVSGGAFDVTCRPLVNAWKQAGKERRLPNPEELAAARALVNYERVIFDRSAQSVMLPAEGMQIDLGGIAKGQSLDLAKEAMIKAGAKSGVVDIGGDVIAFGQKADGQPWRVGVKHPFQPGVTLVLNLIDRAVATSGLQQRFYEIGGKRYSHIIDPRTGRPVEQSPSVTVIAPDGITADAWATVFSVLSPAEGQKLIGQGDVADVEVMWISGSAESPIVQQTTGFNHYVVK